MIWLLRMIAMNIVLFLGFGFILAAAINAPNHSITTTLGDLLDVGICIFSGWILCPGTDREE